MDNRKVKSMRNEVAVLLSQKNRLLIKKNKLGLKNNIEIFQTNLMKPTKKEPTNPRLSNSKFLPSLAHKIYQEMETKPTMSENLRLSGALTNQIPQKSQPKSIV
jgi:hypothetical protein